MSQENVETIRRIYDGFLAGVAKTYSEGKVPLVDASAYHPELKWDVSAFPFPDAGDGVYRGLEGLGHFWESFLAAWDSVEFEYELIDAGENGVVGLIEQRLRGRATGIELPISYAQHFTFRDGKIAGMRLYQNQHEGLAGLRE